MTKPHKPCCKAMKHYWTAAEIAALRERYSTTKTATLRLLARSSLHLCRAHNFAPFSLASSAGSRPESWMARSDSLDAIAA